MEASGAGTIETGGLLLAHTREAEHTEGADRTARDAAQYIHSYTRDRETNTLLITLNRYYLHNTDNKIDIKCECYFAWSVSLYFI